MPNQDIETLEKIVAEKQENSERADLLKKQALNTEPNNYGSGGYRPQTWNAIEGAKVAKAELQKAQQDLEHAKQQHKPSQPVETEESQQEADTEHFEKEVDTNQTEKLDSDIVETAQTDSGENDVAPPTQESEDTPTKTDDVAPDASNTQNQKDTPLNKLISKKRKQSKELLKSLRQKREDKDE